MLTPLVPEQKTARCNLLQRAVLIPGLAVGYRP